MANKIKRKRKANQKCDIYIFYNVYICGKHGKTISTDQGTQHNNEQHCCNLQVDERNSPSQSETRGGPITRTLALTKAPRLTKTSGRLLKFRQLVLARLSVRYVQVILSFLAVTVFGLQVTSLMVGIVAMSDDDGHSKYPVQNYTLQQKGLISGMMGCGNSIGNLVLLCLAHWCEPVRLLPIASGLFSGTMAFAVPVAAIYIGFEAACVVVLLQGMGLSFVYPCVYAHLSKWVVPQEQGKLSWVWSGHQVGNLVVMALVGLLHTSPAGWPSVFYIPGVLGIMWGFAFLIWGSSSPSVHRTISSMEREFIQKNLNHGEWEKADMKTRQETIKTPWRTMVTSLPLWALLIVQITDTWVYESMMGPVFLHSVCRMSVQKVGLATAMAYFGNIIAGMLFAFLANHFTDPISLNFSRKFWTAIGLYGGAFTLSLLTVSGRHCYPAVFFLEGRIVLNAATHPGYMSTILNAAPNMAATVASTFNILTSFFSSTGPLYTGYIVKDENDLFEWQVVFCTAILVSLFGCTFYLCFGSTEPQTMDSPRPTKRSVRGSNDSALEKLKRLKKRIFASRKLKTVGKLKSLQVIKTRGTAS